MQMMLNAIFVGFMAVVIGHWVFKRLFWWR